LHNFVENRQYFSFFHRNDNAKQIVSEQKIGQIVAFSETLSDSDTLACPDKITHTNIGFSRQ